MGLLTEMLKESFQNSSLNESLTDSELKSIHKKCKDIVEFCDKYKPLRAHWDSMKNEISSFINTLIYDTYLKFDDIIPSLPSCFLNDVDVPKSINASNIHQNLKESADTINNIHKAINGRFGDCIKALPKSNIAAYGVDYSDKTLMRIELKKSNPNIIEFLTKKGIDCSQITTNEWYSIIFVPCS